MSGKYPVAEAYGCKTFAEVRRDIFPFNSRKRFYCLQKSLYSGILYKFAATTSFGGGMPPTRRNEQNKHYRNIELEEDHK